MVDKPKILIVDDREENLYALDQLLKKLDVEVIQTLSGSEALNLSLENDFCMAIVDIQMPEMDGYELVELLRSNEGTATLPVIFVSAIYSDEYHHRKGYEAGAVDFMSKPFIGEILLSKVRVFIELYQQRQTLEDEIKHRKQAEEALQASNQDLQELSYQLQENNNNLLQLTDELEEKNSQLEEVTADLQAMNNELVNITDELQDANLVLSKRAVQLETSNQVGQQVTSILELKELLAEVVKSIQSKFGYYFVGVWLLDKDGEQLILEGGRDRSGERLLEEGLSIALQADQKSLVAWVIQHGEFYLADDVSTDSHYLVSETLPDTRSELALPLRIGTDLMGVLDIASDQLSGFTAEDQKVLQMLANQIAIAIRNVRLYEMEKKLNVDKDKFFSIISHDLRGPFTGLLGNAQFMAEMIDKLSREDIVEMSEGLYRGAKAVHHLLENLLTWSRMQQDGRMEYQPEMIELYPLAQETVNVLSQTALQKNIHLENTIAPDISTYADKNMIDMVIRNLAGNAIKFTTEDGTITLSAKSVDDTFVEVAVTDTGIGISHEDIEKLFRINVNHTTMGTNKEIGSGLGLIICKEMVERNGGQISISSELGQGTTVKFTVPRLGPVT